MTRCCKIPYDTSWQAGIAMRAIRRKPTKGSLKVPVGAYFCSDCKRWHLTSKSKTQTPPWARR